MCLHVVVLSHLFAHFVAKKSLIRLFLCVGGIDLLSPVQNDPSLVAVDPRLRSDFGFF